MPIMFGISQCLCTHATSICHIDVAWTLTDAEQREKQFAGFTIITSLCGMDKEPIEGIGDTIPSIYK